MDYKKRKRLELKRKCVEYKGGRCQVCGYSKSLDALEFHHIDKSKKSFSISDVFREIHGVSWDTVREELDKCILVCANCHRDMHSSERIFVKDSKKNFVKSKGKFNCNGRRVDFHVNG